MKQLYDEVNEMKKLMNNLKQGGAIGEMFEKKRGSSITENDFENSHAQSVKG